MVVKVLFYLLAFNHPSNFFYHFTTGKHGIPEIRITYLTRVAKPVCSFVIIGHRATLYIKCTVGRPEIFGYRNNMGGK